MNFRSLGKDTEDGERKELAKSEEMEYKERKQITPVFRVTSSHQRKHLDT